MKGEGIKQETDRVYVGMVNTINIEKRASRGNFLAGEATRVFFLENRFDYIPSNTQ